MAFNPDLVKRWDDEHSIEHHIQLEVVKAADYDTLLALYKTEVSARKQLQSNIILVKNKLRLRWPLSLKKKEENNA